MHINSSNHFKISKFTNENNNRTKKPYFLTAAKELAIEIVSIQIVIDPQIVKHTFAIVNKLPKS
jgi:hypothetical protein